MMEAIDKLQQEIESDPNKLKTYAIVLTELKGTVKRVLGNKTQYVNQMRPFEIVGSESETRKMLETEFPGSLVVIAPKMFFLMHGGFDLLFDDFKDPLTPTGEAPTSFLYEASIEADIERLVGNNVKDRDIEQFIRQTYPESEATACIDFMYDMIKEEGLTQVSGFKFLPGKTPFECLMYLSNSSGTSVERMAHAFKHILACDAVKEFKDF